MSLPSLDSVNYTFALVGTVAIGVGWWRGWFESPRRKEAHKAAAERRVRDQAVAEAILGEPAVLDLAGTLITPAKPGLVSRTATLEIAVSTLIDQDARIKHLETDHGSRIKALEDIRMDKLIGQVESANMWRAVVDNAITDTDET